jgi:hypothetical protein
MIQSEEMDSHLRRDRLHSETIERFNGNCLGKSLTVEGVKLFTSLYRASRTEKIEWRNNPWWHAHVGAVILTDICVCATRKRDSNHC